MVGRRRDIVPTSSRIEGSAAPVTVVDEDRRSASRVQTVLRIAQASTKTDEGLARVQNISDDGIRLRLHIPVLLGEQLTIDLAEGVTIRGRVIWSAESDCGIQLDEQIDSAALLTKLEAQQKVESSRPPRLKVNTPALVRGENGARAVEVTDISQRGVKIRHDGSITEGLPVTITMKSGNRRPGVVRWSRDGVAGILLLEPFSVEELGRASDI
jgi:hypothetical protein